MSIRKWLASGTTIGMVTFLLIMANNVIKNDWLFILMSLFMMTSVVIAIKVTDDMYYEISDDGEACIHGISLKIVISIYLASIALLALFNMAGFHIF